MISESDFIIPTDSMVSFIIKNNYTYDDIYLMKLINIIQISKHFFI